MATLNLGGFDDRGCGQRPGGTLPFVSRKLGLGLGWVTWISCAGSAFLPLAAAAPAVASWILLRKLGAMSGPGLAPPPWSSDEKLRQPGRVSELLHSGACLC